MEDALDFRYKQLLSKLKRIVNMQQALFDSVNRVYVLHFVLQCNACYYKSCLISVGDYFFLLEIIIIAIYFIINFL